MSHLALDLPADVQDKIAQIAAVYHATDYGWDEDEIVLCLVLEALAQLLHKTPAEAITSLVRYNEIRKFLEHLLDHTRRPAAIRSNS